MWNKSATSLLFVLVLAVITVPIRVVAEIASFDAGLDGWSLVDVNGSSAEGDLRWVSSGGNPGGYAEFYDEGSDGGFLAAPSQLLGDWRPYDEIMVITYDHRILETGAVDSYVPYEVRIDGMGGVARWTGATPAGATDWIAIEVPLRADEWQVLSGTWSGILAEVGSLRVRIEQIDGASDRNGLDNIVLSNTVSAVAHGRGTIARLKLGSIFPNPFNPTTTVSFELQVASRAYITVSDVRGRLVSVLLDKHLLAGYHEAVWNGTDASNRDVPSGVYLLRVKAAGHFENRRITLLK